MARPRKPAEPADTPAKKKSVTREQLEQRAAARNYTIEEEDGVFYAAIGGTRFGPMKTLEALDEFLPEGG